MSTDYNPTQHKKEPGYAQKDRRDVPAHEAILENAKDPPGVMNQGDNEDKD